MRFRRAATRPYLFRCGIFDQRFFIAYAQAWQGKDREDAERQQILTDPHSPDKYRVNGIVRNVDAWYKAFNVKPGDALYLPPEERVYIW